MDSISYFASFMKMLAMLALVLALITGSLWVVKKLRGRASLMNQNGNPIQVLATKHLSQKASLVLVDVLGELILVGLSGGQMTRLSTISDPSAKAQMKNLPEGQALFPSLLGQFFQNHLHLSSERTSPPVEEGRQERPQ